VDGGQKKGFWKTSHLELHLCSLFTELISFLIQTHTHRLCSKTKCACLTTAHRQLPSKAHLQHPEAYIFSESWWFEATVWRVSRKF